MFLSSFVQAPFCTPVDLHLSASGGLLVLSGGITQSMSAYNRATYATQMKSLMRAKHVTLAYLSEHSHISRTRLARALDGKEYLTELERHKINCVFRFKDGS